MQDKAQNPPPETRPQPERVIERKSFSHTVAESYLDGTAKAAGVATVAAVVHGASKLHKKITSKDEGSKIVLPRDPKD